MSNFKNTKYIYTQNDNDDRGIAWSKYILAPIIVEHKRINQVYNNPNLPEDKQIEFLFSIKNNQDTSISKNFIIDVATYHAVLSLGN